MRNFGIWWVGMAFMLFAVTAFGDEEEMRFSGSGFLTAATGKMLGGTRANVQDYNCPCFISDYAQGGVYDGRSGLQWSPDSKMGLQGSASYKNALLTGQVVARGATGAADLEWLYGSYNLSDSLTIQAGRKRLPMFYYSDVQDIGFSLPWTHLPPGPYGWEVVNYNGANLRYQDRWSDWSVTANLLAGSEHKENSGYWKMYNGRQSRSSVKWTNIAGGDLTLSRDWLETRLVYIQSDTQQTNTHLYWDAATRTYGPAIGQIYPQTRQHIMGLAVNGDFKNWFFRSEFIQIRHPGLSWDDHAELIGAGYRYGKWQPFLTWSEYRGTVRTSGVLPTVGASFPMQIWTVSMTLRYDLTASSALKLQYDYQADHSDPATFPNYGNARLLTFAFESVF